MKLAGGVGRRTALRWTVGWAVCVLVVVISGVSQSNPAVALSNAGHWVYNHSVGAVFHIDGASKAVDGEVPTPHLTPAAQVVEDEKNSYVVDNAKSKVVVLNKSTLKVSATLATGTSEKPVALESGSNSYLVYRHDGNIVRLGDHQTVVRTGGALESPVGTTDGTVWVRRADGAICHLGSGDTKLTCSAHVPAQHNDTLVTLDDRPAVVDATTGTVDEVNQASPAKPLAVPGGIPAGSRVATTDAGGRLPAIVASKTGSSLMLIDTSTLGTGAAGAAPITVPLGSDDFDAPLTAGASVVLIDQTTHDVATYDNRGRLAARLSVPGVGKLHATRGEDGRVYVDNGSGTDTTVVDGDGTLSGVADKRPDPVSPLGGGAPADPSSTVARPTTSGGVPTTAHSSPSTHSTPASPTAKTPAVPAGKPSGPAIGVDITPHSNDIVNVEWQSIGTGASYVVQAVPSGTVVCRGVEHSCNAHGLPTGKRTAFKVTGTTAAGAVRTGTSPDTVIPWHWATAPTRVRALAHATSISVTWQTPTNLKAGRIVGWSVDLDGKEYRKTMAKHITVTGLRRGKLYRINISAITRDPNGSAVTIAGDQSTTFVKTG